MSPILSDPSPATPKQKRGRPQKRKQEFTEIETSPPRRGRSVQASPILSDPSPTAPIPPRAKVHRAPWCSRHPGVGWDVWGLSYLTPDQTRHANRPLQLAEEVTVHTCAYVQTCLNTLGPLHIFSPPNNAVHRRMFIYTHFLIYFVFMRIISFF